MSHPPKTLISITVLILLASTLLGCASLGTVLDAVTDPRLLDVIDTLQHLVNMYRLNLQNPALLPTTTRNHREHLSSLEEQIEEQLQILETIGYARRARAWRIEFDFPANGHS